MNQSTFYVRLRRLATVALLALVAWPLGAQTNPQPPVSDRYLLIVDTSAAMRRRASGVQNAVESLLHSTMAAQLQRGDTVGVWTYNEKLQAGHLPLQFWTPENSDLVASNIVRFIKAQTYEGESRFETVVQPLSRLIQESRRLTVMLISDGDERFLGTSFHDGIARAYASKFAEQQKARMPFVTVLRAARGRITSATVNLAPWPADFPTFPPEPVVEAPKPEVKPKPEPPRPVVPNLIVIGKKKQDLEAATNATSGTTNLPAAGTPATSDTNTLAAANVATNAVPDNNTSQPASAPVQPVTDAAPAQPAPQTIAAVSQPETTTPTEAAVPATSVVEPPAAVTPALPEESTTSTTEASPPPDVAVAVASTPGTVPWMLIAAGAVPIVLGVGVFFLLRRRTRDTGRVSLITRSLDRDQE
jgi:hypothetical protein